MSWMLENPNGGIHHLSTGDSDFTMQYALVFVSNYVTTMIVLLTIATMVQDDSKLDRS